MVQEMASPHPYTGFRDEGRDSGQCGIPECERYSGIIAVVVGRQPVRVSYPQILYFDITFHESFRPF